MTVSRAKRAGNNKWDKENMKIVACKIRIDKAERFKEYADSRNTTPNALLRGFINECIGDIDADSVPAQDETMQRDNATEILEIIVKKGRKEAYREYADIAGENLNEYIMKTVDNRIANENGAFFIDDEDESEE